MDDQKSMESALAKLGRKIDFLIGEIKKAGIKISGETEKKVEYLKKQKDKIGEEFKNKSVPLNEKWFQSREHLNEAADAMRKAFKAFSKKP